MPRVLPPEKEQELVNRYQRGENARILAKAFEIAVPTVYNTLKRQGEKLHSEETNENRNRIIQARSNSTIKQVATQFGVSESTVTRITRTAHHLSNPPATRPMISLSHEKATTDRTIPQPSTFEIARVPIDVVEDLCAQYHGYHSAGQIATYVFAVIEDEHPVAAYAWQPPPLGAARAVCPESPASVLALSRMIAIPREQRLLQHISKPLRYQMKKLIDRTRWPVLITYSDEGLGHNGHVYKCSGWQSTERVERVFYVDSRGRRITIPTSDNKKNRDIHVGGTTILQRWEHWACPHGEAAHWMNAHGWKRIAIPGRVWRSGNPAFTWIRE